MYLMHVLSIQQQQNVNFMNNLVISYRWFIKHEIALFGCSLSKYIFRAFVLVLNIIGLFF